jgi:hypothetical protein
MAIPPGPNNRRFLMKSKLVVALVASVLGLAAVACTPPAPAGTITCDGGSGVLRVSPAVNAVDKPVTYSLIGPSTSSSCTDRTGTGVTSARFDSFAVTFPSLSCYVTLGTQAAGRAVLRWSDGTESRATATATLQAAYGGTLDITLTSGHFAGMSGTANFTAAPLAGSCFDTGITRESISIDPLTLRAA